MQDKTSLQEDEKSRIERLGRKALQDAFAAVERCNAVVEAPAEGILKEYTLMNKDKKVADFTVDALEVVQVVNLYERLPEWIKNFRTFIIGRQAPKQRENIKELLIKAGCDTLQGYLDITHALSLIDTYWVREKESSLSWSRVSLYTNEFNEVVAKTAFEGGLHGDNLSTTSPEYGTDGSFAKCWVRENGQIRMLKRGSSGARNAGLEPYSEYYAAQVAAYFSIPYVSYDLRSRNGRVYSACDIFTSEKYGYLPYAAVAQGQDDVISVLELCDKYGVSEKARTMFVFDAVIMNEDRHKGNFGFLIDNDMQEIVDFAPLFDHNISLLPYAEEDDFRQLDTYLQNHGPRLARTFLQSAKICLTPELRKILINLKGFTFARHPRFNLPEWRLAALENQVQKNIRAILE